MSSARFQTYGSYSDSGSPHTGMLPEGWQRRIVSSVSDVIDPQPDHRAPAIAEEGDGFPYIGIRDVNVDGTLNFGTARPVNESAVRKQELAFSIDAGDIVFCKVGTLGIPRIIRPHGRCALSATLVLIKRKENIHNRYLLFALDSTVITSQTDLLATGSTRAALGIQQIRKFQIPYPPREEQTQIAQFLDYETAKIDALIEKQQQLIALLKEKRQAVISHAVTKGLNPDAPMRDSGVEWLGEVPAHWGTLRLGALYSESSARAASSAELQSPILSVSIHHGISDRELDADELDRKVARSEDRSLYKTVRENDLAYNMMRAWQGGFGAATLSGLISPAYVVCKPKVALSSRYFELVLRTPNAIIELKRFSRGITDFRLRLYWDDFKSIVVPVPPRQEMDEIVDEIAVTSEKYNELSNAANAQITLLQERRTALISAAVTGKIDVRNWKPPESNPEVEVA